jgi:methyl-accepting chemotaxis protein
VAEDPGALREAIEQTRAEMGETIEALGHKADVKSRAAEKLEEGKQQIQEKVEKALADAEPAITRAAEKAREVSEQVTVSPQLVAVVGAGVLVLLMLVRRARKRH